MIGPGDVDVCTGTPPSNLKVVPELVALMGMAAMLVPIALVRNEINVALFPTAEGMK